MTRTARSWLAILVLFGALSSCWQSCSCVRPKCMDNSDCKPGQVCVDDGNEAHGRCRTR